MNRTRLLLIGFVALALGAIVSFTVYRSLQTRAGGDQPPGVDVVVAANDVPVGAKIEDRDVKVVRFPAADLPPNCFHLEVFRGGPRRGVAHRQGRVLPAQQTGWGKRRVGNAISDSTGNARGFGAGQ